MVKLPAFFSDGMVIGKQAKLWGKAEPKQKITANFLGTTYETDTDETGRFEINITSHEYGGPHSLKIDDHTINDVYVGRVWLCGGTTNMEEPVSRASLLLGEKIPEDRRIRIFQAERGFDFITTHDNVQGNWQPACGGFLQYINAMPYFFARALLEVDSAPIGLICIPVGGTVIEGWLPEDVLQDFPHSFDELVKIRLPGRIEKTREEDERRTKIWQGSLNAKDAGILGGWHESDYNDSEWESRMLFDTPKLPRFGAVWLRRKFTMPPQTGEPVILRFGRAQDSITVYVNGREVIHVSYMYPPCACVLPDDLLVEGENTISVRIVGESRTPSVVPGKEYALVYPSGRTELNGEWKWKIGAVMPMCQPGTYFFSYPCGVYNYMLAPLLGLSLDGVIWSQGESDTANPYTYKAMFTAFVNHLREKCGEIPVIFTQTAGYVDPYSYNFSEGFGTPGDYWVILREEQRKCLEIPNTAMVVTIDCGEYNDPHPADKKTVGNRLALQARRLVYGEDIVSEGPMVTRAEHYHDGRLTIFFRNNDGLWQKGGHPLLDVIDEDGVIHRLYAAVWNNALNILVGNMIPVKVRFGWADCPVVPLYNSHCLPASPFEIAVINV